MKMAKCQGNKKPADLLKEYGSLYGSDSKSSKSSTGSSGSLGSVELSTSSSSSESTGDCYGSNATLEFCPDACLAYFAPVYDEDGNRYSNECYMAMAKCSGKKKKPEDILAHAESLYGPLFEYSDSESNSGSYSGSESSAASASMVKGTEAPVEDGSDGLIENTKAPAEKTSKSPKSASQSNLGSLFDDSSSGVLGNESEEADPTLVKEDASEGSSTSGSNDGATQQQQQQSIIEEDETSTKFAKFT